MYDGASSWQLGLSPFKRWNLSKNIENFWVLSITEAQLSTDITERALWNVWMKRRRSELGL